MLRVTTVGAEVAQKGQAPLRPKICRTNKTVSAVIFRPSLKKLHQILASIRNIFYLCPVK